MGFRLFFPFSFSGYYFLFVNLLIFIIDFGFDFDFFLFFFPDYADADPFLDPFRRTSGLAFALLDISPSST